MRLPSAGTGSVYAGGRLLANVHYTIKRSSDGVKADLIVVDGEQTLDRFGEVTLETKEGHKLACTPEAPSEAGVCTFRINELG